MLTFKELKHVMALQKCFIVKGETDYGVVIVEDGKVPPNYTMAYGENRWNKRSPVL